MKGVRVGISVDKYRPLPLGKSLVPSVIGKSIIASFGKIADFSWPVGLAEKGIYMGRY